MIFFRILSIAGEIFSGQSDINYLPVILFVVITATPLFFFMNYMERKNKKEEELLSSGDIDERIIYLKQKVYKKRKLTNNKYLIHLLTSYFQRQLYEEYKELFEKSKHYPIWQAHFMIGVIQQNEDSYYDSINSFRRSFEMNEENKTLLYLSYSYFHLEDFHRALNCFVKYLELESDYAEIYFLIDQLFMQNRNREKTERFQEYISIHESSIRNRPYHIDIKGIFNVLKSD